MRDKETLKYVIKSVASRKNHFLYEFILNIYDRSLKFQQAKVKRFEGNGYGKDSLDTYRVIETSNNKYFEKIYFNDSSDMKKVRVLKNLIFPVLYKENDLKVPSIKLEYQGKYLTSIYYDYLLLEPLKISRYLEACIEILPKINKEYTLFGDFIKLKQFSYKNDYFFKRVLCRRNSLEVKASNVLDVLLKKFDKYTKNTPLVLSHGDINIRNIFENKTVLDFDNFGFYPVGYDYGMVFYQCRKLKVVSKVDSKFIRKKLEKIECEEQPDPSFIIISAILIELAHLRNIEDVEFFLNNLSNYYEVQCL